jgi:hypothetical protein
MEERHWEIPECDVATNEPSEPFYQGKRENVG